LSLGITCPTLSNLAFQSAMKCLRLKLAGIAMPIVAVTFYDVFPLNEKINVVLIDVMIGFIGEAELV
jgi:hypothetical protein